MLIDKDHMYWHKYRVLQHVFSHPYDNTHGFLSNRIRKVEKTKSCFNSSLVL